MWTISAKMSKALGLSRFGIDTPVLREGLTGLAPVAAFGLLGGEGLKAVRGDTCAKTSNLSSQLKQELLEFSGGFEVSGNHF